MITEGLLVLGGLGVLGLVIHWYGTIQRDLGRAEEREKEKKDAVEKLAIMAEHLARPVDADPAALAQRLRERIEQRKRAALPHSDD